MAQLLHSCSGQWPFFHRLGGRLLQGPHLLATQLVISKHSRLLTSSANTLSAWQGVNFKWTSQSGGRSSVHHRCSLSTDPKFHSWQDLQEGLDDAFNRSPNCTAILTLSCPVQSGSIVECKLVPSGM